MITVTSGLVAEIWWSVCMPKSHWSFCESFSRTNVESPQVSRTRLSILAVLSNADVWIVSTRPPTSKSSRPFNNPLVTVPNAPITVGTIVTFMFPSFFQFSSKVELLILLFTFLQIYSVVNRDTSWEFFPSILSDGLSREFEWQQIYSSFVIFWASFRCSYITFMVLYLLPYFETLYPPFF